MTIDVRATGLKWFNSDGDDILGTGTTIDILQMVGITPVSTECLNSGTVEMSTSPGTGKGPAERSDSHSIEK